MENTVSHNGKIVSVSAAHVFVKIERGDACGECKNKQFCHIGKSGDPIISIQTDDANTYSIDEEVRVIMRASLGFRAVVYAYLLPLVFLLTTFIVVSQFISSEIVQVLLALIPVVAYYIILYKIRDRLEKTFKFHVSKI